MAMAALKWGQKHRRHSVIDSATDLVKYVSIFCCLRHLCCNRQVSNAFGSER